MLWGYGAYFNELLFPLYQENIFCEYRAHDRLLH